MALARSLIVDQLLCSIYHCVSRCVRRQFLLSDAVRAAWLEERLELLASLFAIDVLEFAILANHVHLLLRIRPELAWCWTAEEVAERWLTLRAAGPLGRADDPGITPTKEDIERAAKDEALVDEWRRRLADLGWFHKELKEPCARLWNAADDASGHFWEGRYSSKVALDDVAVTAQAFYVMLNAVRAGVEGGVGRSRATSIGTRLKRIVKEIRSGRHGDAVEAYEKRIVNGSWQPALPCRPGSVADLPDAEYSARVARGRRKAEVRNAALKESETLQRLATDAPVEDLVTMMTGGEGAGPSADDGVVGREDAPTQGEGEDKGEREADAGDERERVILPPASLVRIPRHRLRRRPSSRIPADAKASEESFLETLENPFRRERVERGSTAVLPGMTLGTLVQLLDHEGRQVHPGKRGRILPSEPAALERFRAMALGGEIEEPAVAAGAGIALDLAASTPSGSMPHGLPSLAALDAAIRTTVTAALVAIEGHRQAIEDLLEDAETPARPEAPPDGAASEPPAPKRARVRWFGSANGLEPRIDEEAARRGSFRVVSERPLAAA